MKNFILVFLVITGFTAQSQKKISALIVDGQNNHDQWPKITMMIKTILEQTGRFKSVDISRYGKAWNGDKYLKDYSPSYINPTQIVSKPEMDSFYAPDFKKYDVIICNFGWNAAPWPVSTQKSFEDYMKKGGGLVVFHAADNSFPEWPAYNEMIGLGGWGNRTEKDGPYVYYNKENKLVIDSTSGKAGSHGPQHEFTVRIRDKNHPITKGMPDEWLHTIDELYDRLRGPAKNMQILSTAYSSPDKKGTDRHEPNMMVIRYGKGRIFHTPMGHIDQSVSCVGFITCMQRGAEWAATGQVTIPIPSDFPTKDKTSAREVIK